MKKYLMMGVAAAALASCSHDVDFYNEDDILQFNKNQIVEKYNQAFIETFGQPAANQDWGFGDATRGVTRSAIYWTDNHNHVDGCTGWEGQLDFTLPAGAVQIDTEENSFVATWDGNKTYYRIPSGDVLYISEKFEGDLQLSEGFNGNVTIYNYGKVTNISLNYVNGTITYYNAGTLAFNLTSGTHIFYNAPDGELTLNGYANVGHVYNNGELYLANSDLRNDLTVHSAGSGIVYFPNGAASGDGLQSTLDIHGKAKVTGDMKIGNDKTQYICELEITGTLNLTKGHLQTSYVKANEITFDGDRLYLLPGAHVVATTMRMPNSATYVYASRNSNALIELTNIYMQNTNNFNDSFDDNIYFDITGVVDFSNSTLFGGGAKHYNNVAEYIADKGNLSNNRLGGGYATGSPACGQPWTVGTPDTDTEDPDPDPETPTTPPTTPDPDPDTNWEFYARVFAEDLSASTGSDFDFNDVVFDVYNHKSENKAKLVIRAAGGTLPLTVAGVEVHGAFAEVNSGVNITVSTMINTGGYGSVNNLTCPEIPMTTKYTNMNQVKDIEIAVEKKIDEITSDWFSMTAEPGRPTAKFAVQDSSVNWCNERENIEERYTQFGAWVRGETSRFY